jgi:hypothetical protein
VNTQGQFEQYDLQVEEEGMPSWVSHDGGRLSD